MAVDCHGPPVQYNGNISRYIDIEHTRLELCTKGTNKPRLQGPRVQDRTFPLWPMVVFLAGPKEFNELIITYMCHATSARKMDTVKAESSQPKCS